MKTLLFSLMLSFVGHAADADLKITSISIFRVEVQFEKKSNQVVSVGKKIMAKTYTDHKCLLVVNRVSGNKVTTDATQCPGFATLKKGEIATLVSDSEINEEVRANPRAAVIPNQDPVL